MSLHWLTSRGRKGGHIHQHSFPVKFTKFQSDKERLIITWTAAEYVCNVAMYANVILHPCMFNNKINGKINVYHLRPSTIKILFSKFKIYNTKI